MMGEGMGEMMAGGMGGMMGGLGGMMGGMGGGGMGGGMGAGIGSMIRQGVMANAMNTINEATHFIVGPQANPDQVLINFAMAQRRPPSTMTEMFRYLPHFQRIAKSAYGPWLLSIASDSPANAGKNTTSTTGTTGGKTLAQLEKELDAVIMERAIQYMDQQQTGQRPAAAAPMGMASMGMMIPAMIQGIQGAYM